MSGEVCRLEYRHGGDIYGTDEILLDFSVNTNPFGMPEGIRKAVIASSDSWERYPDSLCRKLRQGLADYYGMRGGQWDCGDFICGNGASDLFYTMALALRPRRAVLTAPSFAEYERALRLGGCGIEWYATCEAQGFSPEAEEDAFFSFVERTDGLSLVMLGNPNNPNGLAVSLEWLSRLADICREKGALLAVDECFNWFVPERERYSALALLGREEERFAHVLVFQAFTKIYAIPGLRAGYAVCKDHAVLRKMEESRQPWSLSAPAEAAALAALKEDAYAGWTARETAILREELAAGLRGLGFAVYPSAANYLLFRRRDAVDYAAYLRKRGILIRSCANYQGLGEGYYRVSVRRRKENEALLRCLREAVKGAGSGSDRADKQDVRR